MTSDAPASQTSNQRLFDPLRLVLSAGATAALAVAAAAAFLHFYPRANDVGPTAAALGDASAEILGLCLGLLVGSAATALFVRRGSRFFSGLLTGVAGFCVGVMPYELLTAPSDVSVADALAFTVIILAPALVFIATGAAIGAAFRNVLSRR